VLVPLGIVVNPPGGPIDGPPLTNNRTAAP
jgi:hypothetical protein